MKLRNVKIDESIKRQFTKALEDEHTVIDPTTADALENEENVKKQIDTEFKENDKAADDLIKATAPEEKVKVKNRKELTKLLSENKNRKPKISRCLEEGFRYLVEWEEAEEKVEEPQQEESKEPKLETFDEQMDFLAADEQEAIEGYEKVINLVEDEHVKEQLNKILVEEKAHKDFLEKVKKDKELKYTEPLESEESKEESLNEEWQYCNCKDLDEVAKLSDYCVKNGCKITAKTSTNDGYKCRIEGPFDNVHKVNDKWSMFKWRGTPLEEDIENESLNEEPEAGDCAYHPERDEYYYLKKTDKPNKFELFIHSDSKGFEIASPRFIDKNSPFYNKLKLHTKNANPEFKESLTEESNYDKVVRLLRGVDKNENLEEASNSDYFRKMTHDRDSKEQDIQMVVCEVWSKYSNTPRSTIYDLVANLKNDFPELKYDGLVEKASKAIVDETMDDYLDTGNTDYLDKNYKNENLEEAKNNKMGKGTVGAAINKNREKIDNLAFRNKTEMVRAVSKILEDDAIEDKAYAKEVLRNVVKKRTSADILTYLYDIMLKQIGLGSPDAPKEEKEESLTENQEPLTDVQKELLDTINRNKADGWYDDDFDDDKDIAYNAWIESNIEIPEDWCKDNNEDYENVSDEAVDKYFYQEVWKEPFISRLKGE